MSSSAILRIVTGFLLALSLSSCSSNGANDANPDHSGPGGPSHPNSGGSGGDGNIDTADLQGLICSPSKAAMGVEECISSMDEDKRIELPRRMSTWGSLGTNEFVDALLDREAFRERFHLSDREVQCLKSKMCREQ